MSKHVSAESAIWHLMHLERGMAFQRECPYCCLAPSGSHSEMDADELFYHRAQASGRKSIPLSEYF